MALGWDDLALLSARFGVARFGASRFGFVPCPEDVKGAGFDEPGEYIYAEQVPPTQEVVTEWTLVGEDCVCRNLCTLDLCSIILDPVTVEVNVPVTATVTLEGVVGQPIGVVRINWGDGGHEQTNFDPLENASDTDETELVGYWPLSEASGIRDDATCQYPLTEIGIVGQADGNVGEAADFTAGYLTSTSGPALNQDFTISLWFKLPSTASTITLALMVDQFQIMVHQHRTYFEVDGWDVPVANWRVGAVDDDEWHHIIAWVDTVTDMHAKVSFDGEATQDSVALLTGSWNPVTTNPLFIGELTASGLAMQRVAIWNRALSTAERTAVFNAGVGREEQYGNIEFTHNYNAAGDYTITVEVTDERGCSASTTRSVTVNIVTSDELSVTWIQNAESESTIFTLDTGVLDVVTVDVDYGEGAGWELDVGLGPYDNPYGGSGEDATYSVKFRVNAVSGTFELDFDITTNWAAGQSGSAP